MVFSTIERFVSRSKGVLTLRLNDPACSHLTYINLKGLRFCLKHTCTMQLMCRFNQWARKVHQTEVFFPHKRNSHSVLLATHLISHWLICGSVECGVVITDESFIIYESSLTLSGRKDDLPHFVWFVHIFRIAWILPANIVCVADYLGEQRVQDICSWAPHSPGASLPMPHQLGEALSIQPPHTPTGTFLLDLGSH